jgi:hypothetical protein
MGTLAKRNLYVKYIFMLAYNCVMKLLAHCSIRLVYDTDASRSFLIALGEAFAAVMTDESKYSTYF